MLYISTFGDMGVSVFQIVGLIQKQLHDFIGLDYALLIYLARLLPGPFFSNRPTDFYLQLSESIGGGSLHALGEGYLISGLMGCGLIGAFFGVLIAVSMIAGNLFQVTRSPIMWIIFLFPWLLLIRGGWYQFFSFLKSLEILLLLIFFLVVIDLISKKVQKYFN